LACTMVSRVVYTIVALIAFVACGVAAETYGELALKVVHPAFLKAVHGIPILKKGIKPDDVHTFRKDLLATRNLLDIFAYAYPIVKLHEAKDVFQLVRLDVSEGYVWVGRFQDLKTVNYTQKDYDERLDKCIKWGQAFVGNIKTYDMERFVQQPSNKAIHIRPKSELSDLFWGIVKEVPLVDKTGLQNVGILAKGMVKEALDFYDRTIHLEEIWLKKYHEEFHGYRKLLRSIEDVANAFPNVFKGRDVKKDMDLVDKAYGTFGKLNDIITEYQYYVDHNDAKKAEEKKKEVVVKWKSLRDWLEQVKFRVMLKDLENSVI